MKEINVFIFDRLKLVRLAICKMLEQYYELNIIGQTGKKAETIKEIRKNLPHLVLISSNTGVKELNIMADIKEISQEIKILCLLDELEDKVMTEAKKLALEGVISKNINSQDLRKMIKKIIVGKTLYPNLSQKESRNEKNSFLLDLTKRENQVLQLMAYGLSNKDITEKLYISEKTVKNHIYKILKKMSVKNRTQAVITAFKQGMVQI